MIQHQNIAEMFLDQARCYGPRAGLLVKSSGSYHPISWCTFQTQVEKVGVGLARLGVRKGSRVALLSENRPEWVYVDLGALGIGAVTVPIYATFTAVECEYVIRHSGASVLVVSNREQLEKIYPLIQQGLLAHVIVMEEVQEKSPVVVNWGHFLNFSDEEKTLDHEFESFVRQVEPDDLATLIYTSGTTGPPKGVMLSHRNFLVNCEDSACAVPLRDSDITLSFLPLSHVFERLAGLYFPLRVGATIAFAENMTTVPQNMLEIRPTYACGVPRMYEKIYQQVMDAVEKSPPMFRKIIRWAFRVGADTIPFRVAGKALPLRLKLSYRLALAIVFRKLQNRLGGRLRFFISGGAALPRKLGEFFYAAGIQILEGYGLTETSPVIAVNRLERLKFGTVGIPMDHIEAKIAEDGEILVRGPSVMRGYYRDEAATAEAIRDGWFYTGDIGGIDRDGFLFITDRKKDVIVTSGGKNISPQNVESLVAQSPFIRQAVVLGDNRPYLIALIVPDFERLEEALALKGIPAGAMAERPEALELIRCEIDEKTIGLANYEKIKYFKLLPKEFSQAAGELTPTLKIKRKVIEKRCTNLINAMYEEGERRKRA